MPFNPFKKSLKKTFKTIQSNALKTIFNAGNNLARFTWTCAKWATR
ncbi:MAG: hypothetical protein ACI952_001156, partial [Flavobacteriales bacterium]